MKYHTILRDLSEERLNKRESLLLNNLTHRWIIVSDRELKKIKNPKKEDKKFLEELYSNGISKTEGKYKYQFDNSMLKVSKPFYLILKISGKCNFKKD